MRTTTNYDKMGLRNNGEVPKDFIKICKMSQARLKDYLARKLKKIYEAVHVGDGFIYAEGGLQVCLTAHMDTVHKNLVKDYYVYDDKKQGKIISSPQGIGGDDRCGIWMILQVLRRTGYRPHIIFCEDEEIGGVGSGKFLKTDLPDMLKGAKFFIELDRAHGNDLVFYDDENREFQRFCEKVTGYKTSFGSFSDISNFCPSLDISGVNMSCGYYNAHTTSEYVVVSEMERGVEKTIALLEESEAVEQFKYEDNMFYSYYYDDIFATIEISWIEDHEENSTVIEGETFSDCLVEFFMDHPGICWNDVTGYYVMKGGFDL